MPSKSIKKPEEEFIQYVGLNDLEAPERQTVQEISQTEFEKLRNIAKLNQLKIHIKCYGEAPEEAKKKGKTARRKFSIRMKANVGAKVFDVDKAHDYDLVRALRKSFKDMQGILKHQTHGDTTRSYRE